MKRNNLIKTTAAGFFVFAILALLNLVAAPDFGVSQIGANLEYDDIDLSSISSAAGADSVSAFGLGTPRESIMLEGGDRTDILVFVSESGFRNVYFNTTTGLEEYESDTFTLNSVEYTIERAGTGSTAAYKISSAQSGSLMIGTQTSNTLIMPDNGRNIKILVDSRQVTKALPAVVIFNSRGAGASSGAMAESDAAERSSVSGTASEDAEPGCTDNDENDDDNGIYVSSHVSVVNDDGEETITPDYCARRGDVTRLYEAVCTSDDSATVRMVVCPGSMVCKEGACREPGADVTGKYCLDSDELNRDDAEALTKTVTTKGTTVGFYTATCTGENECMPFSAWSDYCRDRKTLIEYYCSEESRQGLFREIICSNGCEDGLCQEPPYCYDSDGGAYSSVKGTIRGVNATGEYFNKTDTCKNGNTVIEYRCTPLTNVPSAEYAANGFAVQEMPCGAGKHCNDGKCVVGEPACNQCDPLNNFNIREGTECNGATPSAWNLKRCPAGQYCSANACVAEPKATMTKVTYAFDHRKKWALLLNETLGWIETAKQITPLTTVVTSGGYAETMEQIATGLSGTQTLLLRRQINLDVQADFGGIDLGGRRAPI